MLALAEPTCTCPLPRVCVDGSLQLGGVFTVVLSSCAAVHDALVEQSAAFAGRVMLPTTRVLSCDGQDLVFSDFNASWKLQRRLAHAALFNASKLRGFSPAMVTEVQKLVAAMRLGRGADDGSVEPAAATSRVVEPHALLRLTSMNIIASLVRARAR